MARGRRRTCSTVTVAAAALLVVDAILAAFPVGGRADQLRNVGAAVARPAAARPAAARPTNDVDDSTSVRVGGCI